MAGRIGGDADNNPRGNRPYKRNLSRVQVNGVKFS